MDVENVTEQDLAGDFDGAISDTSDLDAGLDAELAAEAPATEETTETTSEEAADVVAETEAEEVEATSTDDETETDDPDGEPEAEDAEEETDADKADSFDLSELDPEQMVKVGDEEISLQSLLDGYAQRVDRDTWLKKTNAIAEARQEAERHRDGLGALVENINRPHMFLDEYLSKQVEAQLMPAAMLADIDAVFSEYIERGEYDRNAIDLKAERVKLDREAETQRSELRAERYQMQAQADVTTIEAARGIPLSDEDKTLIREHILSTGPDEEGNLIPIAEAYKALVDNNTLKRVKRPTPSGKKLADMKRKQSAPRKEAKKQTLVTNADLELALGAEIG